MPRLMGLELSLGQIAFRFAQAVLLSMLAFILLFYVPSALPSQVSGTLVVTQSSLGRELLSTLIAPTAPTLGLFIVLVVFACALLRGTKVYGFLLVLNGLAFLIYVYSIFQGGTPVFQATGTLFGASDATLSLSLDLTTLMAAFMVPPSLAIVKGLILMFPSRRR